jgi:hypothetical protein
MMNMMAKLFIYPQLRYYSNCKRFKDLIAEAKVEAVEQEFAQFNHLLPMLKEQTGRNFTENPLLFQTLYDLFRSQVCYGQRLSDDIYITIISLLFDGQLV